MSNAAHTVSKHLEDGAVHCVEISNASADWSRDTIALRDALAVRLPELASFFAECSFQFRDTRLLCWP